MATPQESQYVTLISNDDYRFVIERKAAMVSGTIKSMLSGGGKFVEAGGEIRFKEISGFVLQEICRFCYYKLRYTNATGEIPPFQINPEYALQLMLSANFLDL